MAVFADIAGRYVINGFAGCIGTVVATHAVTGDRCMIEVRRYPAKRGVTTIAIIAARDVRRVFADCN